MRPIALVSTLAALSLACVPEKDVPANPTWVDDVQPILQGNCFHCHGAEIGFENGAPIRPHKGQAGARFDLYDSMEFADAVGDMNALAGIGGYPGKAIAVLAVPRLKSGTPAQTIMPPPPALPLSDWERKVIEKWQATGAVRGKRSPNAQPRVIKVAEKKQGADLLLTFDVLDDDGDQVLGRVEAGAAKVPLLRSGRHTVTLKDAANATPKWVLSDGQDTVTR